MQYIDIFDYLLLPVYLFAFYWVVRRKSARITDPRLRKILMLGFIFHMLGSIAYSLIVQYYYGYGDSFIFYVGSSFFHDQIIQDPSNLRYLFAPSDEIKQWYDLNVGDINYSGYFGLSSSAAIMKISAIFSFLCFNKFLIISLCFGMISFLGQWKLFNVFRDVLQGRHTKLLAVVVLYSPSICFWGSGLMKDSLCLGALGFIIHLVYRNLVKKQFRKRDWLLIAILLFLIFIVKSYIVFILLATSGVVFLFRYVFLIKNIVLRIFASALFIFLTGLVLVFSDFDAAIKEVINDSYAQLETYKNNYESVNESDENSRGAITMSDLNPTLGGLFAKSPEMIFSCLFRPFPWESRKLIMLFSSLETSLLLLAFLYLLVKTRILGFFKVVFFDQMVLFCMVLSILFAMIIGFTTFNFGTMARYKIIFLPFFYFALVRIYDKSSGTDKRKFTTLSGP